MSLNFFDTPCKEPALNHQEFGICDPENGTKAYTTTAEKGTWGATVKNENRMSVAFTAIDKCVLHDGDYPGRGRCDGMLTTDKHLYLVELKNTKFSEDAAGLKQIESTIQFLQEYHPDKLDSYTHKKGFVCNKRRPQFQVIENEKMRKFRDTYGFRIDLQAKVVIV